MQQALYDQLVNRKVKIDFGMYSNPTENSAAPNYDPRDKSIKFKNNSTITKENLKEELFHAWQDAYYEGDTTQYGKDAQGNKLPGYVNVEFEAKVFKDIIVTLMGVGSSSAFYIEDTEEGEKISRQYRAWLYDVLDNPSILKNQDVYNYWLDLFNEQNPIYSSPKSNDLESFQAISDLLDKSKCSLNIQ